MFASRLSINLPTRYTSRHATHASNKLLPQFPSLDQPAKNPHYLIYTYSMLDEGITVEQSGYETEIWCVALVLTYIEDEEKLNTEC